MDWKTTARQMTPPKLRWRISHARLGYWRSPNFGDLLGPYLIERIFRVTALHTDFATADLVAVGSVLELLEASANTRAPRIWGSGFIKEGPRRRGPKVRVHAVRGQLTAARLRSYSPRTLALGDPGLLAPLAIPAPRADGDKTRPVCLVPHYVDFNRPEVDAVRQTAPHIRIVDVRKDVVAVVQEIATSSLVLSSSLHGLVIADAYGVPSVWTPLSDGVVGGAYKFEDYYSAFDVSPKRMSLDKALGSSDELIERHTPKPQLRSIREGLLRSFPGPKRDLSALLQLSAAL